MKRALLVFCLAVCVLSLAAGVYAECEHESREPCYGIKTDDLEYKKSPVNKFSRGAINTATFWAELSARVCDVSKKHDPFLGLTLGVVEGTFTSILRGVSGVYDMVTFIVPPYDKPLMSPEYALNSLDEKMREDLW